MATKAEKRVWKERAMAIKKLTRKELESAVLEAIEVLYPAADPDQQWETDTIEWVAHALGKLGI